MPGLTPLLFVTSCGSFSLPAACETAVPEPMRCAAGEWPELGQAEAAIFVSEDGSSVGTGRQDDPVDSMEAAMLRVLDGGSRNIAVGPGEFLTNLTLDGVELGSAPVTVAGCSAAETKLSSGDYGASVVGVFGGLDVVLAGMTLSGGTVAVHLVGDDGDDPTSVRASGVTVTNANQVGIHAEGGAASLVLEEVEVSDVVPNAYGYGYGIIVDRGELIYTSGSIFEVNDVGVLIAGPGDGRGEGVAEIGEVEISGVIGIGRGVHLQGAASVTFTGTYLHDLQDSGIMAIEVGSLTLESVTVEAITGRATPDSDGETYGDGMVATVGEDGGTGDPEDYQVTIGGATSITDTAEGRASLIFNGVTATIADGLTIDGDVAGQGDAEVDYGGTVEDGDFEIDAAEISLEGLGQVSEE